MIENAICTPVKFFAHVSVRCDISDLLSAWSPTCEF